MTPKTRRIRNRVSLFASVILAMCAFAVAANAQPSFTGSFTLPYEVHWGTNVLPAGEYTIVVDSLRAPALIRSANGKAHMYTAAPIPVDCDKKTTSLFVTVRGNQRMIHSMSLPASGVSLIFARPSSAEPQMLAEANAEESLPVATTRK